MMLELEIIHRRSPRARFINISVTLRKGNNDFRDVTSMVRQRVILVFFFPQGFQEHGYVSRRLQAL